MPKVVTANMLATGSVVFFGPGDTWVGSLEEAVGFDDEAAADAALARAQRDQDRAIIVEPFLAERGPRSGDGPEMSLRDRIRAFGPTVRFGTPGRGV